MTERSQATIDGPQPVKLSLTATYSIPPSAVLRRNQRKCPVNSLLNVRLQTYLHLFLGEANQNTNSRLGSYYEDWLLRSVKRTWFSVFFHSLRVYALAYFPVVRQNIYLHF